MQEIIKIDVVKQLDGYNFSLSPSTKEKIKKIYPLANPINSVFVDNDTQSDFETYIGKFEKYIYPLLLGLDSKSIASKKPHIKFIDPINSKTLYTNN